MNQRKTLGIVFTVLGLILTVAGPLLPGGLHLKLHTPPGAGHVTAFSATPNGDILAGTQAGEVWRLRDDQWTRERLNVGDQPVLALLGDPGRTPVGTAAGLAFAPAGAPPLEGRVSSLLQTEQGLLAGTATGVRLLVDGAWQAPGPAAMIYSLVSQRRGDGQWLHAGTINAGVLSGSAADPAAAWQPNNQGLPDGAKVFSFATTRGGLLLTGTDQGAFWQSQPGQSWQSLHPALDGKRVLSLLLADDAPPGRARLWIGSDDGLSSLAVSEQGAQLVVEGSPQPADSAEQQPPLGISGILSSQGRLLVSAGMVYEYGPTALSGWYWISFAGVLLILIAGWLIPPPVPAARG